MKVTSIDIYTSDPDNAINFSFRDPRSQNPYNVKTILGLDADEIVPKFYGVSDLTTDKHYELTLQKRNVVVQIGLNPNFTENKSYSDLRNDLYKLISSSRTGSITLKFKNGIDEVAGVSGFITKFEAPLFVKVPEVQITISCNDPMIKALQEVNVPVAGLNEQLTVITDSLSTAPHGVRFGVKFTDEIKEFYIQDAEVPTWAFHVDLTGSTQVEFKEDDELHFSSETNNKYLYMIRGFDIIPLVDKIVPTSVWPVMFPGDNTFVCSEKVVWDYITYYPTYWGV